MRILIFDTETTGLLPKNHLLCDPTTLPYIVQLSYMIYNETTERVEEFTDVIISLGTHIPMSPESTQIHGITREISLTRGIDIRVALFDFKIALSKCGKTVAHNHEFDMAMILLELRRNQLSVFSFPSPYCTMRNGTNVCKLNSPNGFSGYKWPKLLELHKHLFDRVPKNVHNSKIDTIVTLRCYYMLNENIDLCRKSRDFRALYRNNCTIECDRSEFDNTYEN